MAKHESMGHSYSNPHRAQASLQRPQELHEERDVWGPLTLQPTDSSASATSCLSVTKLEPPNKKRRSCSEFLNHRNWKSLYYFYKLFNLRVLCCIEVGPWNYTRPEFNSQHSCLIAELPVTTAPEEPASLDSVGLCMDTHTQLKLNK